MVAVATARGVKLLIKVGDGADPEVFETYCSVNAERGITFTAGTNDQEIPDCTDPELLAWLAREKTSLSGSITGSGALNVGDELEFFNWLKSPDARNAKVIVDQPGGTTFTGAWHLTEFSITGNRGEKQQSSISLSSDGEITAAATV